MIVLNKTSNKRIVCPCCKSRNVSKVCSCENILQQKQPFYLLRCKRCKHEFIDPLPSDKELKKFYGKMYDHQEHLGTTPMTEQKLQTLKIINKMKKGIPKSKINLLDLGAGNCDFFRMAKKEGYDTYGIDYSVFIETLGLPKDRIMVGDLRDKGIQDKFDVITISHVLEHLRNPNTMISAVYKALRKDGIMIARVPNNSSYISRLMRLVSPNNFFYFLPPSHLHYFNPSSIEKIVTNYFNPRSVKVTTFPYLMMNPYAFTIWILKTAIKKEKLSLNSQTKKGKIAKSSTANKIGLKITNALYSISRFIYDPISTRLKLGEDLIVIALK